MIESSDRVQQFKAEIADMRLKDPASGKDAKLLKLGGIAMLAGVAVTVVSYFMSHGTSDPLAQNDAQTIGMIGIALAVPGGALFLRYSLAQFLRFWLARLIYEQQAQTDRILSGLAPTVTAAPSDSDSDAAKAAAPPVAAAAAPAPVTVAIDESAPAAASPSDGEAAPEAAVSEV
jgi:hypothetical protein